jgi:hypothetical protein
MNAYEYSRRIEESEDREDRLLEEESERSVDDPRYETIKRRHDQYVVELTKRAMGVTNG